MKTCHKLITCKMDTRQIYELLSVKWICLIRLWIQYFIAEMLLGFFWGGFP